MFIYKPFFIYSKQQQLEDIYNRINTYYNSITDTAEIALELERVAIRTGIDILIKTDANILVFASTKDFLQNISQLEPYIEENTLNNKHVTVKEVNDKYNGMTFMVLYGKLDNGYFTIMRLAVSTVEENVKLSNIFLYITGMCVIIIASILINFISRKFTKPIKDLEEMANRVANLDFSLKYIPKDTSKEIDNLGKSINTMSDELERTINKLQEKNIGLEKDIEEKAKIDEMRKQFISDVSHELKTPIALIQGYAEGLKENINADEESKNDYIDVIIDEANKMDSLVKRLLELMKLEYKAMEFNDAEFNIIELIKENIRKSYVIIEEKGITVKFNDNNEVMVYADEFYIDKVITNYLTNAIKYVTEIKGEKYIEITVVKLEDRVRINVFNTGNKIKREDISRIWNRFYKTDSSRNRNDGSTGIGLAFVKAIMNNYNDMYGVENKENGVNFYFELFTKQSNFVHKKDTNKM